MRFRPLIIVICLFALHDTALPASKEKNASEQEFCRLDRNADREITLEEFKACEFYKLEHVRALPYAEPKDIGPGKGGTLSDDELKSSLFKKADKNADNKISRKEWEEFYNSVLDPGGGVSHGHIDRR